MVLSLKGRRRADTSTSGSPTSGMVSFFIICENAVKEYILKYNIVTKDIDFNFNKITLIGPGLL
jgi:hypothetical protein